NRDGVSDLLTVKGDCLLRYTGNGSGPVGNGKTVGCGWADFGLEVATPGDINGDGNGDILAIRDDGCLYRWLGNGNLGFGTGTLISCSGWSNASELAGAGDLNGDGRADALAIRRVGTDECMWRWWGTASGGLTGGQQLGCGWGPYTQITGLG